ncbi:hypothetical protein HDF10_000485 [Edaphobacter lichenicola]|uniref:Uncharacterized protein n=1 Tax=Tunturiibacter lichenicola TaxID=2051959 RepID=A0A7W8J4U1_9BACT|nr:hypothetical protein [Edaphobacter lichenicola]
MILDNAQSVGLLRSISDKQYVDLKGTAKLVDKTNSPQSPVLLFEEDAKDESHSLNLAQTSHLRKMGSR